MKSIYPAFGALCFLQAVAAFPSANTLDGILLGTQAMNISAIDLRPDAAHPFIAPEATDQRGNCPGLNTLANHGYLPRNGITTVAQAVNASCDVFNMGPVLATFLSSLIVAFAGNVETDTFSIGGEDLRTYSRTGAFSRAAGKQYGSDAHARIDGDMSPTRADFYLAEGDSHSAVPARFRRFVELAKATGGTFNSTVVNKLFVENAKDTISDNPKMIRDGWTVPVSMAAYGLLSNIFGNGTIVNKWGGVNNYETVSSLLGFELKPNGEFCYKPERIPSNWYRSAVPFDFASGAFAAIFETYGTYPFLDTSLGELLSDVNNTPQAGCYVFQSVVSAVPSALHGSRLDRINGALKYVQQRILTEIAGGFGCNFTIPKAEDTYKPEPNYPPWYDPKLQEHGVGGGQKYGVCG